jgi:quinol monooxygenase YgiN
MIAVCVTFRIKPEMMDEFMEQMLRNARASVENEPGCLRFDVCSDGEDMQAVFLYELYSDHEAFAAHQKTDHFLDFNASADGMIAKKEVRIFDAVSEGG